MISDFEAICREPSGERITSERMRGLSLGSNSPNLAKSPVPSTVNVSIPTPSTRIVTSQPGAARPETSIWLSRSSLKVEIDGNPSSAGSSASSAPEPVEPEAPVWASLAWASPVWVSPVWVSPVWVSSAWVSSAWVSLACASLA